MDATIHSIVTSDYYVMILQELGKHTCHGTRVDVILKHVCVGDTCDTRTHLVSPYLFLGCQTQPHC